MVAAPRHGAASACHASAPTNMIAAAAVRGTTSLRIIASRVVGDSGTIPGIKAALKH
jgi:hypothetical protein